MKNPPIPILKDMSTAQLQAIVDLTEARILKISKDDLRMTEEQLLWSDELEAEVVEYWTKLNEYWKSRKLPSCTCADHEGGFLASEKYNNYFYQGEPCSINWYRKWKDEQELKLMEHDSSDRFKA